MESYKERARAKLAHKNSEKSSSSLLHELVRLKLEHRERQSEVITSITVLRTAFEQENLGIDDREAEKLIRNVQLGRIRSRDVSGFIVYEKDYRLLRNLGLIGLLW